MANNLRLILITILLSSLAPMAIAGPNWQAIEDARGAKQEEKQTVEKQKTEHDIALEKLKAACEKVKDNVALAEACRDIIAIDTQINTRK